MRALVAELVVPYIEGDAAFARFVSCTSRRLVPRPCQHWERRYAPLMQALGAGTACFVVWVRPVHDLFGELAVISLGVVRVRGPCADQLVRQLREAGDRLNERIHPAFVTLEAHCAPRGHACVAIEWRPQQY
jgi:hypothetical protein